MIGEKPDESLQSCYNQSLFKKDIYFLQGIEDKYVRLAYSGATLFLFPSLAEGFGWPIAEAMACGCPVITTNEAPMTEVAGTAAFLIDRRPADPSLVQEWAQKAAEVVSVATTMELQIREAYIRKGIINAKHFCIDGVIDQIDRIYYEILSKE
jgi:glycosyltransferase involved in cell wall biosynthesis